jgi:hypothetical protein
VPVPAAGNCTGRGDGRSSLGSGNHSLEVKAVEEVYDAVTAQRFGLTGGQVVDDFLNCASQQVGVGADIKVALDGALRYGLPPTR